MSTKTATLLLVLLWSWALVGGCPVSDDGTDGPDGSVPADSIDDDSSSDSDGDSSSGDDTSGDSSSDDSSSDDGSSDDGTSDTADDSSDDSGDDGSTDYTGDPAISGTYSGQWTRVGQESLGDTPGAEEEWTTYETITFGADGIPTSFIVPGYLQTEGGIDFIAEVKQVGDTVTLEESADGMDYTLTVTVALANYGESAARVVLNLVHHGEGSNDALTQDGTGVQVIEYSLVGGQLEYSSTTAYEVTWFYGGLDTTWDVSCEGTLSP